MNPLQDYPAIRKVLYNVQWAVNLVLGVIGVVLTTQGSSPQWFIIVGLVFNFVWSYTGITASSNTAAVPMHAEEGDPNLPPRGEGGYYSAPPWLSVVVLVLVILIFLAVFGFIGR